MKKQVYNPYLPSYEYIPDGEPRVFDDRLYIYGSHDRFGGRIHSTSDVGINGYSEEEPCCPMGNTHGGLGDTYDPGTDPGRSVSAVFPVPWGRLL